MSFVPAAITTVLQLAMQKKADVIEHPKAFDHIGLHIDEPPAEAECPLFVIRRSEFKLLQSPRMFHERYAHCRDHSCITLGMQGYYFLLFGSFQNRVFGAETTLTA
jgi:hypothetical protein